MLPVRSNVADRPVPQARTLPTSTSAPGEHTTPGGRAPLFLGIDPGQSGGVAWIEGDNARASKMPETERDLWDSFAAFRVNSVTLAVIERVSPAPGEGVVSAFTFGQNYGLLRGFLIACAIPFVEVSPSVWQKRYSLPALPKRPPLIVGPTTPEAIEARKATLRTRGKARTEKKNALKAIAQQLFPLLKITHATADALLLATYARMLHTQRTGTP